MKSNKTMYTIAKAMALEIGPRAYETVTGKKIVGYYLTRDEQRRVFATEGFNTTTSGAWLRRMQEWDLFGDITNIGPTIFFNLFETSYRIAAESVATTQGATEVLI